ncbi:mechanosensitive ion channel [Rhodobacteraceae bacterium MCCB 386]|nr:mechanosensitive ion channel [Roseitranquillus sediminis]
MIRSAILVLSLLPAIALPALAQEETAPPQPPIAIEDVRPDAAIAARLRQILQALDRDGIAAEVEAGVVTLTGEVADPSISEEVGAIAARLEGVVAVRNDLIETSALAEQLDPAVGRFQTRVAQVIARLPLLLLAGAIFAAVVALGWLAARARLWDRLAPNAFIAGIYRQAVRIVFALAGLVMALDLAGATALLGTILGAAGIVGLAIGFAVRDTVENFVASVMLSLRQPFRPNDLVEIEGDSGRVIRLTSRATILLSLDGNHIRIPNATVFKSRLVNYTRNPERRFVFDIGIDPEADLEGTRLLVQRALGEMPFVLARPEALVWIENLNESGAILRVTGWIDQEATGFATARSDAIRLVKAAIEAAGVSIPDTTYRIRLEGVGAPMEAPAPAPRQRPAIEAPPQAFQQSEEKALIALVSAERRDEEDLLRRDAPQE